MLEGAHYIYSVCVRTSSFCLGDTQAPRAGDGVLIRVAREKVLVILRRLAKRGGVLLDNLLPKTTEPGNEIRPRLDAFRHGQAAVGLRTMSIRRRVRTRFGIPDGRAGTEDGFPAAGLRIES